MTLTVSERVLLLNILPGEGDVLSLRIIRKLREALSFSEEEHAALNLKHDGGFIHWNAKAAADAAPKNVELGPKAQELIADALKQMSAQKKLREEHLGLWEKFVPEE